MKENLAGKTFGRWTVQEDTSSEKGYRKWLCRCDCGTVRMVNKYNLVNGKTRSCGCLAREQASRRYRDLTGLRFGRLVAKERAGHLRDRTAWRCICDCGKECRVAAHDLVCGHTKSCGCLSKGIKDLTNQRFGKRLQALYPTEKRDYKGSVIWYCRCDCGNEKEISEDSLLHGNWQSCGCLKEEIIRNKEWLMQKRHFYQGTCLEALERRVRTDNKSGHVGVTKTQNDKYRATIGFRGKRYDLGRHDTLQEAVKIREEAEEQLHKAFAKSYRSWLQHCKMTGEELPFHFEVQKTETGFTVSKTDIP